MGKVRLSKSFIGDKEQELVRQVLAEEYLGMGRFVQEFERGLSHFLNNKVVAVNSGTAALHLALLAIGVGPEDEVLVPSLTYVASFQAISATGAKPVPCDVRLETGHIDLKHAQALCTKKTKAIMPVHYAGNPVDLDKLQLFAQENNLRIIEDAAHAFGSYYKNGKKVGEIGDVICFSFDGIKNITSGEGGALVCSDDSVIQFAKDARLLGVQQDTEARYKSERSWEFDVTHQGFRYHMSNLFAGIGIAQLERFESEFKPRRQGLAKTYVEKLAPFNDIEFFKMDFNQVVPHIFPIRVIKERDQLRKFLIDSEIEVGIHYYPNHRLTFYKSDNNLLNTEKLYEQLLTLPLHPEVSEASQDHIIEKTHQFYRS